MNASHLIANRFEIQDLLGRGGMGGVYRAKDTQTGEIVAVKALNPEVLERDPSLLERFVREGDALRQLNHPNIVRMVAAVEEGGHHYLVMEYVEGGSLKDLLSSQNKLPAGRAIEISLDLADALTRAHRLGIIHRDLKPANVLLAKDGTPRLADFGIAYIQDSSHLTQSGTLIGTVDYLSPEVCQGEAPNELSDIWAFGVMLFEMLSGKLPFEGKSMTAKITAILHQPVPDLTQLAPDTPNALIDLIYRMLEKDSRQRIPSVRGVGAELEGIQKGRDKTTKPVSSSGMPAFLEKGEDVEPPVFVTRENELAQLDRFLYRALEGHGQVAFITGDPGQGKTALTQEFARRAREKYSDLIVASGNCNAYTGIGDPYLPFREILGLLCGDIESRWEARAISREQAKRLWQCIPLTVQALVESARDLVEILVSGDTLVKRVAAFSPWSGRGEWLSRLEQLVQHKASTPVDPNFQQAALFEQYTRVLRAIAHEKPLMLILDDMQWADSASINLLFHVGKRIEGSRVMILGTYRTTELALGRDGQRHPLEPILNEFKRQFGNIQIELGKSDGRRFVDAFVDSEPNRLDENFRATLFRVAGGHPLGTVELLRDLQERGGIVRDQSGVWVVGTNLDWEALPARLEAMIAERIERLDSIERRVLKVASVEGETFTAEVIARVLSEEPQTILNLLNEELDKRHRLVNAQNIRQQNGRRLSIYRFQHILFQRYLHGSLNTVERSNLHQSVGTALTELYAEGREEISGQLAHHFQEAGTTGQAADYLKQAGDRASDLIAYKEAIEHYEQAKTAYEESLGSKWDVVERATLERKIGEAFYRRGELEEAQAHYIQALSHLGWFLPKSRWGIRLAILGEVIKQIGHRWLPRLFVKPINDQVDPAIVEAMHSTWPLGWITAVNNVEFYIMLCLRCINVYESTGCGNGISLSAAGLGVILQFIPLFRLANKYHVYAIETAEKIQDPESLGGAYTLMGLLQMMLGEHDTACEYLLKAAPASIAAGNLHDWGFAIQLYASTLQNQGKFAVSVEQCQNMIHAAREIGDLQIECWALSKLGYAQLRLGKWTDAQASLQKAVELAKIAPNRAMEIEAGRTLGQCYLYRGEFAQALQTLHVCQESNTEHPEGWGIREWLSKAIAEAYITMAEQSLNDTERRDWLSKAGIACRNAIKQTRTDHRAESEAMRLLGTYEWLRGKHSAAQKHWQLSLVLSEKMGQRYDLGMAHLEIGRRLGDKNHLEQAQTIFVEIGAEWDLKQAQQALEKL